MQHFGTKSIFTACFAALIVGSAAASYEGIRGVAADRIVPKSSPMSEVSPMKSKVEIARQIAQASQMASQMAQGVELDEIAQAEIGEIAEIEEIEEKRSLMGGKKHGSGSYMQYHRHAINPASLSVSTPYIQTMGAPSYYFEPRQAMMPQPIQMSAPMGLESEEMYEAQPEFFGFFPEVEQSRGTPIIVVPTQNTTQVVGQRTHQQSRLKTRPTMINRPYTYDPQKLYAHDSTKLYNKPYTYDPQKIYATDSTRLYNKPHQHHDGGSPVSGAGAAAKAGQHGHLHQAGRLSQHNHGHLHQHGHQGQHQKQKMGQKQLQKNIQPQSFEQLSGPAISGMPDNMEMGIPLTQQYQAAYPPQQQFIPYGAQPGVY